MLQCTFNETLVHIGKQDKKELITLKKKDPLMKLMSGEIFTTLAIRFSADIKINIDANDNKQ
jgi:hypothetical protein